VSALVALVQRLEVSGKRICVLAAPGDRRDEDVLGVAAAAARQFDHIIVRRDDDPRGRKPDEVPQLLKKGLLAAGHPADAISVIVDEQQAIDAALRMARRDDLVLVFGDKPSRCWKQIIYFKPEQAEPAPVASAPSAPVRDEARGGPDLPDGVAVISDERGVRLAREVDD
jgi:cyanophycin synthetase